MLQSMINFVARFLARMHEEKEGQALVEYALILSLVAVVAIAVLVTVGSGISNTLGNVASHL